MGGGAIQELPDAASFHDCMLAAGDNFMIVDFTAKWCGPCKMIAPIFAKLAQQHPEVTFAKVDVDENQEIAARYKVRSMPTFQFMRHGKVLTSFGGADERKLRQTLETVREQAFDRWRRGTSVTVHGLQSADHRRHNDTVGTVMGYDWATGRYTVNLGDVNLALRPANLLPVVECVLAEGAGAHAGKTGRIVGVAGPHRYRVKVGADTVDVAVDQVRLPVGTVVYVDGLVGGAKYNGLYGRVDAFDDVQGRYVVQIRTEEQVKLKPANVFAGQLK